MKIVLCEVADASHHGVESLSPYCLKVHRALRLAKVQYERRHAGNPAAFKAHNPMGQVPVLLVDGRAIPDSTYILRFLEEKFPAAWTHNREAWLWEELFDRSLYGYVVAARWIDEDNWPITKATYFGDMPGIVRAIVPDRLRRNARKKIAARDLLRTGPEEMWGEFRHLLDHLETRAPEKNFWLGEIGVADLGLFAMLQSFRTRLTEKQKVWVEERPKLVAYLGRVDVATQDTRGAGETAKFATNAAA